MVLKEETDGLAQQLLGIIQERKRAGLSPVNLSTDPWDQNRILLVLEKEKIKASWPEVMAAVDHLKEQGMIMVADRPRQGPPSLHLIPME